MNTTIDANEFFITRTGERLPEITATIKDIGTFEAFYFVFIIWVASVVTHEFCHWLMLLRHNKDAKIIIQRKNMGIILQTGTEKDYSYLTSDQKADIYLAGILGGTVPIIIAAIIHPMYLLTLPAYIVGTYRDFQLLWGLRHGWKF